MTFYNRQGGQVNLFAWAAQFDHDRRVAEDTLPDGTYISTVFLGLDHQFGEGPPLIFETMVFSSEDDSNELDVDRYSTETEAQAGHVVMVATWREQRE